jgi:hypothetical protein
VAHRVKQRGHRGQDVRAKSTLGHRPFSRQNPCHGTHVDAEGLDEAIEADGVAVDGGPPAEPELVELPHRDPEFGGEGAIGALLRALVAGQRVGEVGRINACQRRAPAGRGIGAGHRSFPCTKREAYFLHYMEDTTPAL